MPNAKKKGNRGELQIVKILNERFKNLPETIGRFSRSVGSGNRFGQKVSLSPSAVQTYSGDITCPTGFRFSLEIKTGYPDLDLSKLGPSALLDIFLAQAEHDAKQCGRLPALVVKQDRREPVVFVDSFPTSYESRIHNQFHFIYRTWVGSQLSDWLADHADEYFFAKEKNESTEAP